MKHFFTLLFLISIFSSTQAQALFTDIAPQAGVNSTGRTYGVAFGDYDSDGLDDIYVSRHNLPNLLYRNLGNGTFEDKAADAGVDHVGTTTMSIWGDIDNDGDPDLYLGNRDEPNILYRNNGNGSFTDISASAGVNDRYRTRSIMFSDINMDGYIDLYVANLLAPNFLYKNNGDNTFTDITVSSGTEDNQIAMGAMFFDYDNDGDPDLYLTHDANQRYILLRNNGDETFTDVSEVSNANYAGQGMGTDFGDINNDGFLDIYITNLNANTMLLNNGDGTFSDISEACGATDIGMGWGISWLDYDNDGLQDIYMVNDSYYSPMPNILYKNIGENSFEIVSENTPLMGMYGSYGTACSDVNNDGWVDIFLANAGLNDANQLFLNNNQNEANWIKIKAEGKNSNRSGIGTRVEVEAGGKLHIDEVTSGTGYASQNSFTLHFGLADAEIIDRITVKWPSGVVDIYENIAPNQGYTVTEGESIVNNVRDAALSENLVIAPLYPNPFSDQITIPIELKESLQIKLSVLNLMGQTVAEIASGKFEAGFHQFQWDGNNSDGKKAGAGIYLLKIETENGFALHKMSLI